MKNKENEQDENASGETTPDTQTNSASPQNESNVPATHTPGEVKVSDNQEEQVLNLSELLAAVEGIEKKQKVVSLSTKSIELTSEGESFRGIFAGFTKMVVKNKMTDQLEEKKAVRFVLPDKSIGINAGVNLVNTFERSFATAGTAVEVIFAKRDGNVKIYEVNLIA